MKDGISPISDFVRPQKRPNRPDSVATSSGSHREAAPQSPKLEPRPRPRISKKAYYIVGIVILLTVVGGVYFHIVSSRPILDSAVVARAGFPVYAPSVLPDDYKVDADKTNINDGVLIYTLENQKTGSVITTTVQPWPTGFNMSKMVEGGSINGTSVKVGTLYNLSTESSTKYLLDMGSTLIFLTSPTKVNASIIHNLVDDLEKVN